MSTRPKRGRDSIASILQIPDHTPDLLKRATVAASATARWEVADLISELGNDGARDLLRHRVAELARSPLAEDQVLSLVLDTAASELDQGLPPLTEDTVLDHASPRPSAIFEGGEIDSGHWIHATPGDEAWVEELISRRRSLGLSANGLTSRLAEDAELQALLCNDPRIPADDGLRRRMAALVPIVMRRGRELNSSWWRGYFQRLSESPTPEPSDPSSTFARPPILLCTTDHERLMRVACVALLMEPRTASPLLREIERATVIPDPDLPKRVVRLGTNVGYSDRTSGKFHRARLVSGGRTRDPRLLSVLTPVGSALIGLALGETIHWKDHIGLETIVTVRTVEHDATP